MWREVIFILNWQRSNLIYDNYFNDKVNEKETYAQARDYRQKNQMHQSFIKFIIKAILDFWKLNAARLKQINAIKILLQVKFQTIADIKDGWILFQHSKIWSSNSCLNKRESDINAF